MMKALDKFIDVRGRYSREINKIEYILQKLEYGRYYENSETKMDGYLATNIDKLRNELEELIDKIEYNKDSLSQQMKEALDKLKF